MADSDEDYIASSGDEAGAHVVSRKGARRSRSGKKSGKKGGQAKERWEEINRSWDVVLEGDDNINATVAGMLEAGKRKRFGVCVVIVGDGIANGCFPAECLRIQLLSREVSYDI
jgi:hypothetical protein